MLFTINCFERVSVNVTNPTVEVSVEYRTPIIFIVRFGINVYVRYFLSGTFMEHLKSIDTHLACF